MTFWKILDQIAKDWHDAAETAQASIPRDWTFGEVQLSFRDLAEPRFIQCLFSYIIFFILEKQAYEALYKSLNQLNRRTQLRVDHDKIPVPGPWYNKLKIIRDTSIAHFGDPDPRHFNEIDSRAGMLLGAYSWSNSQPFRFEDVSFNTFGLIRTEPDIGAVTKSQDRGLEPLYVVHRWCTDYLTDFDHVCVDYLLSIRAKLPLEVDNVKWDAVEAE